MKNNKIIIIGIIIGILMLLISGTIVVKSGVFDPYEKQIKLGYKMLEEKKYDEAILAFDEAIKIDHKKPKAYIGKGDTYIARFDDKVVDEVNTALTDGYNKNSDEIYAETYIKYADVFVDKDKTEQGIELLNNGYELIKDKKIKDKIDQLVKLLSDKLLRKIYDLCEKDDLESVREIMNTNEFVNMAKIITEGIPIIYIPNKNADSKGVGIYKGKDDYYYIYFGNYNNKIRSGKGIWIGKGNKYIFKGQWSNDKPNGKGKSYRRWDDIGRVKEVSGNLIDGLWDGKVLLTCFEGEEWSFSFSKGKVFIIGKLDNSTEWMVVGERVGSNNKYREEFTMLPNQVNALQGIAGFGDKDSVLN